jgi:hypothetical protein
MHEIGITITWLLGGQSIVVQCMVVGSNLWILGSMVV